MADMGILRTRAGVPRLALVFLRWLAGVLAIGAASVALLMLIARVVGPRPWTRESARVRLERRPASDSAALWRDVDAYVQREMRAVRAPGLGLAVVHGARVIHERGFGVADPGGRPVTRETPFILGSLSKAFTATAVVLLADSGVVELDAPVQRYLPWFRLRDSAASRAITVRQLLNQTSGIPKGDGLYIARASRAVTTGEDERLIRRVRLSHPPGTAFEYSNANYWLLGLLIEAVTGAPYERWVRHAVLDPLGMRHTYTSEEDARAHGLASGYRAWFGFPRAEQLPYYSRELSVGYLSSTPADMATFLSANLAPSRVIPAQALALMHTPPPGSPYAMAWLTDSIGGTGVLWHTGAVANYHCDMLIIPDRQLGVVVLSNINNILLEHQYSQAIKGVAALLLGFEPPRASVLRYRETYWIITLAALLWLLWRARQVVVAWRSRHDARTDVPRLSLRHPTTALVDPGLSVGVLLGLRLVLQTPFSTLRWYVPDLMILLFANVAVSLALAVWKTFATVSRQPASSRAA